jgi:hypothetical protein
MKIQIKKLEPSVITTEDIAKFQSQYIREEFAIHNEKRMLLVDGVVVINPTIELEGEVFANSEVDTYKPTKIRKTIRNSKITLSGDGFDSMQFGVDTPPQNDNNTEASKKLYTAVMIQRLVDAMNGIDVTSPSRRYNIQLKNQKKGRNTKVLLQSPKGETLFIKNKFAEKLTSIGYTQL